MMDNVLKLNKGDVINLSLTKRGNINNVIMQLGWSAAKKKGFLGGLTAHNIDLDASAVMIGNHSIIDTIWFQNLNSFDGSIMHNGDDLTGKNDGEKIYVDLNNVPQDVDQIFFTINSYSGHNFSKVENAYVKLIDSDTNEEVCSYELSGMGNHTAMIMARLKRNNSNWELEAIGKVAEGSTVNELSQQIFALL